MYPTRRMVFLATLGVPLVFVIAAFAPSLWVVGLAWVGLTIGAFLLDASLAPSPSMLSSQVKIPATLGVARTDHGRVTLSFSGRPAPAALEVALSSGSRIRVMPERQLCSVTSGVSDVDFELAPLRRGEGIIEALQARWQGPLGLCWRQRSERLARSLSITPNIASVKEEAVRLFRRETGYLGVRSQMRAGAGAEFHALKDFQSGMDRRSIDWKQTARHGRLLVREFQAEENLHIVFALDTGRLMCEPMRGLPRIDRAIQALLLLAFVALRLGDRVGLFAFDERPVLSSGTVVGPNAFSEIQRLAAKIDYSTAETNFTLGLTQLSGELEHRSIIVVFTDFFDTVSAELMLENIGRLLVRHAVVFVTFRDEELEGMVRQEPIAASDVSRAILSDTMLRERQMVITRLKAMGVDVVDTTVEQINLQLIDAYLAAKHGRN